MWQIVDVKNKKETYDFQMEILIKRSLDVVSTSFSQNFRTLRVTKSIIRFLLSSRKSLAWWYDTNTSRLCFFKISGRYEWQRVSIFSYLETKSLAWWYDTNLPKSMNLVWVMQFIGTHIIISINHSVYYSTSKDYNEDAR